MDESSNTAAAKGANEVPRRDEVKTGASPDRTGPVGRIRSNLRLRIAALVCMGSLLASLLLSAFDTYNDLDHHLVGVRDDLDRVDRLFLDGLTQSVWTSNTTQTQAIIDGLVAYSFIEYARVKTPEGTFEAGSPVSRRSDARQFKLVHELSDEDRYDLGSLYVSAGLDPIYASSLRQFAVSFIFNLLTALLIAAAMLVVVDRLLFRHIRDIGSWLDRLDLRRPFSPLELDRREPSPGDELSQLVSLLNRQSKDAKQLYDKADTEVLSRTEQLRETYAALEKRESELLESQRVAHLGHYVFDIGAGQWSSSLELDRIFGIDPDYRRDVEGWLSLVHPDEREPMSRYLAEHVLEKGRPFDRLYRVVDNHTGAVKWVHGIGSLDKDAAGTPTRMFGTIQDVTEWHEMELALRKSQKLDAIGTMAGGIAHDFNNVLGIVVGNLAKLRGMAAGSPEAARRLDTIEKAATRATALARKLLVFSRRDSTVASVCNLNDLIDDARELIGRASTPAVEVRYELAPDLWSCEIDGGDFTDSLVNLTNNARDAMNRSGTTTIRTFNLLLNDDDAARPGALVGESTIAPGAYVCVSVQDTGPGITEREMERIFEPFYTTKDASRGSGLGLAMVYGFVKRSHGHISVDSTPGQGARFSIYLPRSEATAVVERDRRENNGEALDGSGTILAVDDEPDLLELVVESLESFGYQVLTAANGSEALERLQGDDVIDLLFTDVLMPGGIDGMELAKRAVELRPGLKVLFATGHSEHLRRTGTVFSNASVLDKPYTDEELARRIREILDDSSAGTD